MDAYSIVRRFVLSKAGSPPIERMAIGQIPNYYCVAAVKGHWNNAELSATWRGLNGFGSSTADLTAKYTVLQRKFLVLMDQCLVKIVGFWQHSVEKYPRLSSESSEVPKYSGFSQKNHEHPNRNML